MQEIVQIFQKIGPYLPVLLPFFKMEEPPQLLPPLKKVARVAWEFFQGKVSLDAPIDEALAAKEALQLYFSKTIQEDEKKALLFVLVCLGVLLIRKRTVITENIHYFIPNQHSALEQARQSDPIACSNSRRLRRFGMGVYEL